MQGLSDALELFANNSEISFKATPDPAEPLQAISARIDIACYSDELWLDSASHPRKLTNPFGQVDPKTTLGTVLIVRPEGANSPASGCIPDPSRWSSCDYGRTRPIPPSIPGFPMHGPTTYLLREQISPVHEARFKPESAAVPHEHFSTCKKILLPHSFPRKLLSYLMTSLPSCSLRHSSEHLRALI